MPDHDSLLDALAAYVDVLTTAARTTTTAGDRPRYRDHLAGAAQIFAAIQRHESSGENRHSSTPGPAALLELAPTSTPSSDDQVRRLVAAEQRAFGMGFLSGDCGAKAEIAFAQFAALLIGT